jgi:PqqD family protein of HPr-rel-A system
VSHPKTRDDLTVVVLDGEAVIYDDASGDVHHLNPTATIIFQLLDGSGTVEELAADIAAAFALDPGEALTQTSSLIDEFAALGLLVTSEVVGG